MDYKADPARLPPAGVRKLGEYFSHDYIRQLEKCNEKMSGNRPVRTQRAPNDSDQTSFVPRETACAPGG